MENGKHSLVEYHLRCKATLPILEHLVNELEKNVGWQTSKELEMLLLWKGVTMSKMGSVANRRILHEQFAEGDTEEVSIPTPWTENNQIELNALQKCTYQDGQHLLACFLGYHKRYVEQVYQKMSAKEKVDFKQKMAEMYEWVADNGQPPPPSLTPI